MKTHFLLLALFLLLLVGCAPATNFTQPVAASAPEPSATQRLALSIPGSFPRIAGDYVIAGLPDYYLDDNTGNFFLAVAYLPLKAGLPQVPPFLEEMARVTFKNGVKLQAVSSKSAPCFFDGATTGMTVAMLAQGNCRETEIKITAFVFRLPEGFDYLNNRQVIALQLADHYLVP
jgi:hypothetical protein